MIFSKFTEEEISLYTKVGYNFWKKYIIKKKFNVITTHFLFHYLNYSLSLKSLDLYTFRTLISVNNE